MKNLKFFLFVIVASSIIALSLSVFENISKRKELTKTITKSSSNKNAGVFIGPMQEESKPLEIKQLPESMKEDNNQDFYSNSRPELDEMATVSPEELENLSRTGNLEGDPHKAPVSLGGGSSYANKKNIEEAKSQYKTNKN